MPGHSYFARTFNFNSFQMSPWTFKSCPDIHFLPSFSQVLSGVWPSHLDLDTGVPDQFKENHYLKMLEIKLQSQNGLCSSLQCRQHGEDFLFLEAGTHTCAKCVSPLVTRPLWFPVMVLADQSLGLILLMTGEDRRSLNLVQFQIQNVLCLSLQCWQHGENFLFLGGGPILVQNVCRLC